MESPLVTVICSTYNSRATLDFALRSVLDQSFEDFEVLVIGDGCADGSEEVVRALNDSRLNWFNLARNTGSQSEPNNEGLRRARGRHIAFIGHDDLWLPWHLEKLVAAIEKTNADLVHDLAASIGPNGVEGVHGPPHARNYSGVYVPPSSWLHHRELVNEIGFWRNPDDLSWAIDYDFTRRAAVAGKKFQFVESLGVLKFHSASWKLYSRTGTSPQQGFWEKIKESPANLRESILTQLAAQYAQQTRAEDKKPLAVAWKEATVSAKGVLKSGIRGLVQSYGVERWPIGPLLRHRARRLRSRFRVIRGLAPLTSVKRETSRAEPTSKS
jgi:hypothetical protein